MTRTCAFFVLLAALAAAPAASACDGCSADLDGCGLVGFNDVVIMINNYGPCPGQCDGADLDGDGIVDGYDLGYLLGHWGPCGPDLPFPEPTELTLVVAEITDPDTATQGLREYDILLALDQPDDEVLNVFGATATCAEPPCFVHAPGVGQALPLREDLWEMLDLTFDSFVTIGVQFGPSGVFTDPNFPTDQFVAGGPIGGNAGWAAPPMGEGIAGKYEDNRVRLATFTVEEGVTVEGELTVIYRNGEGVLMIGTASFVTSPAVCPEDIDGSGQVGFSDLIAVLSAWGPCEGCVEDLDWTGHVGFADLLAVLNAWGPCL